MGRKRVLLSAQEVEALIGGDDRGQKRVDPYFPFRVFFISVLSVAVALALIISPREIAASLFSTAEMVDFYTRFFYLRGFLMIALLAVGLYFYSYRKHTGIVFFGIAVIVTTNLVNDLMYIYPVRFADPSWGFTLMLGVRVFAWLLVLINALRCTELPEIEERWNFRLPRQRSTSPLQ